jgi:hypothetical protein
MNATGQTIPPNPTGGPGHQVYTHGNYFTVGTASTDSRCQAGIYFCYGALLLNNGTFLEALEEPQVTAVQATLAGFGRGRFEPGNFQAHPTGGGIAAPPERVGYLFDARPYYGGASSGSGNGLGSNPATLIAGQLYKFPATSMPNIDLPYRKIMPTSAFTGQLPLVDISSPATGNVLGTDTTDSYKYCVAAVANECRQGSAPGDVYVNAPHIQYPYCFIAGQNGNIFDDYDICIAGSLAIRDAITQTDGSQMDNEGKATRILTKFKRPRIQSVFDTTYVLPNAQWLIVDSQFPGDASLNKVYFLGKIPPPAPKDSYNRTDFIPISVSLPAFDGATRAFVRFGYAENGPANSLFCTSRKESCVVGVQTAATPVDPVNPFFFEQTEASTWQPVACSSGCTINLPGIPQRTLYYQFVYQNASGTVYTSPISATMTP